MEKQELMRLTSVDAITEQYYSILQDRIHTDGTHPLYLKGVFDGMEIIISALSNSINERKRLENQSGL